MASTRSHLAGATRVLLVGAGPVGIELAGEITDRWPDKKIVIVDFADDLLGGRYSDELRESLRSQLAARGVRLVLGSALVEEAQLPVGTLGAVSVTTGAGERVEADIWFRCHGVAPSSDYLGGELSGARRPDGFIEVDDRLRVAGQANVFAIGDVTALDEPKRGGIAGRHAQVVADNIRAPKAPRSGRAKTSWSTATQRSSTFPRPPSTKTRHPDDRPLISGGDGASHPCQPSTCGRVRGRRRRVSSRPPW